jgi:hypothetical protein
MQLYLYALALEQQEQARQVAADRRAARHHVRRRPTAYRVIPSGR